MTLSRVEARIKNSQPEIDKERNKLLKLLKQFREKNAPATGAQRTEKAEGKEEQKETRAAERRERTEERREESREERGSKLDITA